MQRYVYRYRVLKGRKAETQSAQIVGEARDDGEAIRTAHVVLDYATLNGAYRVEIDIDCSDGRHIAWIEDGEDIAEKDDRYYLERPIRLGFGYRSSNG